jgi:hypothetical protein
MCYITIVFTLPQYRNLQWKHVHRLTPCTGRYTLIWLSRLKHQTCFISLVPVSKHVLPMKRPVLAPHTRTMLPEPEVNLRPTVNRPVCLGVRHLSGTRDQFFFLLEISFRQLRVSYFVAHSLTRGRVCNLLYKCFWSLLLVCGSLLTIT